MSHSCGPRYNPTLNSCEERHAALVTRFVAGRALAVRRCLRLNKPPPCASQRLLGRLISSLPAILARADGSEGCLAPSRGLWLPNDFGS